MRLLLKIFMRMAFTTTQESVTLYINYYQTYIIHFDIESKIFYEKETKNRPADIMQKTLKFPRAKKNTRHFSLIQMKSSSWGQNSRIVIVVCLLFCKQKLIIRCDVCLHKSQFLQHIICHWWPCSSWPLQHWYQLQIEEWTFWS